jgi:hypothetical protein
LFKKVGRWEKDDTMTILITTSLITSLLISLINAILHLCLNIQHVAVLKAGSVVGGSSGNGFDQLESSDARGRIFSLV